MKLKSTNREVYVKTVEPNGFVEYDRCWLEPATADSLFDDLRKTVQWQTRTIKMFGKVFDQPRLIAFHGDPAIRYRYSGGCYEAVGWNPQLDELRQMLLVRCGQRFNCVLLNLYRDGSDSMGWHADDEPELGSHPVIASVSLGAVRRFVLRRKNRTGSTLALDLEHGSLTLMHGDLQQHWQHQVPKTRRPVAERINLTFRSIDPGLIKSR
ncbi:MAG: alpha-ketoglutarate-dependent dioxygenase AlkB [Xanthomonadaceae bacterium]|nr:alpha-ketoglutarate-dependent dioxygenase AlkB [Xanthomonadaceae bacterium]